MDLTASALIDSCAAECIDGMYQIHFLDEDTRTLFFGFIFELIVCID